MHAGGPEGWSRENGSQQRVTAGGGAGGGVMVEASALPGLGQSGRGPRVRDGRRRFGREQLGGRERGVVGGDAFFCLVPMGMEATVE